ncbi:MAG: hypothetical protein NHB36_09920 [Nitrospira sp.]|nr:hypothetical protein [Nitrospira sp.]
MKPGGTTPESSASQPTWGAEEVRCLCGQLMARLVDNGIELKCKRCRKLVTIPLSRIKRGDRW